MEYNVFVCEINVVIVVFVVIGEFDFDFGSEVFLEEFFIYK